MALKLLQTHDITFTRYGSDTDEPYIDEYGDVVTTTTTTEIVTCGSLQPFSKKNHRLMLPEGSRELDYKVYYTQAKLRTTDQFNNLLPDTCVIGGKKFKVLTVGAWDDFGLSVDNNEYYLELVQPQGS